jgi:hypothetical protein
MDKGSQDESERRKVEQKLKRLARAYVDGLADEDGYRSV